MSLLYILRACVLGAFSASALAWDIKPFTIDFPAAEVSRMLTLANTTRIPSEPAFTGGNGTYGITRDWLAGMRDKWVGTYDWNEQQRYLNSFNQYLVQIENATVHFVHEKSNSSGAIPILMAHGWPGSFHEFLPVVANLTKRAKNKQGETVSFNVIIPSLPGFTFSSRPSAEWDIYDTARLWNTLMVDVLGYESYLVYGTDWGSWPTYIMYKDYRATRAAGFSFVPFIPPTTTRVAADNVTLDAFETAVTEINDVFFTNGMGYFHEQSWKPNTIGLALYDAPLGELAWLSELYVFLSDPRAGTPPSVLNSTAILTAVSLYHLTSTFLSSEWIYSQNSFFEWPPANSTASRVAKPLGFSAFRYNGGWPRKYVERIGDVVFYNEHDFSGHFPGLDNPPALVADIRELGGYWKA